jgi:hypothetical protein
MYRTITAATLCTLLITTAYALPKHRIIIDNQTDVATQFVAVDNKTDIEYRDIHGVTTYTLQPGESSMWPPADSVDWFNEIDADSINLRIWEKKLPGLIQSIGSLRLNDGCVVVLDKVDRSSIFGQIEYSLSPYCHEIIPEATLETPPAS